MMTTDEISANNLTVCMVNYNGEAYLEESLTAVFMQKGEIDEVVLIDNASEDKSLEIVERLYTEVKVLKLTKNRGVSAAKKIGFEVSSCKRILFVDNDVRLTPECSERLMQALDENPPVAVALPRVIYAHNRDIIQYDGAENHFIGLMTLNNANLPLDSTSNDTRKVGSVVGSCFLVDLRRWGDGEAFDDSFFFFADDLYFGLRTRSLGHEI